MKRGLLIGVMMLWILICPILSFCINSIQHKDVHEQNRISNQLHKDLFFAKKSGHELNLEQSWFDDEGDVHSLRFENKVFLTPQFFIFFLYAGVYFLFFFFFKRTLPLCNFLASFSRHKYLSIRTFLI